jgi:electron transport complex protein RnfG
MSATRHTHWHVATALAVVALLAAAIPMTVQRLLQERLSAAAQAQQLRPFHALLASVQYDNDLLHDAQPLSDSLISDDGTAIVYRASWHGASVAVLFSLNAANSYNGQLQLLIGIQPNGELLGVQILAHAETPGLGAEIAHQDSAWLRALTVAANTGSAHLALQRNGGDLDQLSGATITSSAVIVAVRRTQQYFDTHRETLLATTASEARQP